MQETGSIRCLKFTPEEKASIAKAAAESGVTRAIRNVGKKFPGRALRESTVRT